MPGPMVVELMPDRQRRLRIPGRVFQDCGVDFIEATIHLLAPKGGADILTERDAVNLLNCEFKFPGVLKI